ncbi:hypothetical protein J6590_083471 [Homalodisca vitripennis]|nr:hypothetical protein J6590_083471 [Homalodisca vitripennis]
MHKRILQGNVMSETTFDDDTQNLTTAVAPDPDDPANEPDSETQTTESHQNTAKKTTPP